MAKYDIYVLLSGTKYLGTVEAEDREEATELGFEFNIGDIGDMGAIEIIAERSNDE